VAEPYLGQIITVGFPFAPVGWFLCDGKTLAIAAYNDLFALIGTTYGGDGVTTFALPNLNGRVPVGMGQGPAKGLSNYVQGQLMGTESVTLTSAHTPSHTHNISFSATAGKFASPKPVPPPPSPPPLAMGANAAPEVPGFYANVAATVRMRGDSLVPVSPGGLPHENRQPFLALNYIICSSGIYPSPPG
jgi:microcystin-dependent protein